MTTRGSPSLGTNLSLQLFEPLVTSPLLACLSQLFLLAQLVGSPTIIVAASARYPGETQQRNRTRKDCSRAAHWINPILAPASNAKPLAFISSRLLRLPIN